MIVGIVGVAGLLLSVLLNWWVEGGRQRRERQAIREELELAELLKSNGQAIAAKGLVDGAARRAQEYAAPRTAGIRAPRGVLPALAAMDIGIGVTTASVLALTMGDFDHTSWSGGLPWTIGGVAAGLLVFAFTLVGARVGRAR